MDPKLSQEISEALQTSNVPLPVVDPITDQVYVLVDQDTHQQAMAALQRQREVAAIQQGIDDMESGRMQPAEEAYRQGREELLFRFQ
jgi:hypothetical protein